MKQILPNSTVGVFGSGQLGRMFAIEARKMGYRVHTFSPASDTPTGQIADFETVADYEDLSQVERFAQKVDVVTFEFENVPSKTVEAASQFVSVYPRGEVLHIAQNRLREKNFLAQNSFPITPYHHIKTLEDLQTAVQEIGFPSILKTAGFGYDGKGQAKIKSLRDCETAFEQIRGNEAVLEAFVDFEKEVSVVGARDEKGNFAHYGVIENAHANHILDCSFAPAFVTEKIRKEAVEIARNILETLAVVGVMTVEFFLTKDEKLLVNELAPRVHNSGHWTLDACEVDQFEQHIRAIAGWPLGSTQPHSAAVMENLIGADALRWAAIAAEPGARLHLYGKREVRAGRKMGHVNRLQPLAER